MSFVDGDGLLSLDPNNLPTVGEGDNNAQPPVVETPGSADQTGSNDSEYTFTGYMKTIYEKVPEDVRQHVAPYLKEADLGFQNYARQTSERMRGYESLGPVEELSTARALYQTLLNNPQAIYDYLVSPDGAGLTPKQAKEEMANAAEEANQQTGDPRYEALRKDLEDIKKLTGALFSDRQTQAQQQKQEEDTRIYFQMLDDLDKQHKFSDKNHHAMIHRLVASGLNPEDAYTEYLKFAGAPQPAQQTRRPPTVLSGGGVPRPNKDIKDMNEDERKSYLENALSAIARENQ